MYSKMANFLPLVSMPSLLRRICYMVGCNAWGQGSLSAIILFAPALLRYCDSRPDEVNGAWL
jgi:hypothetical protein